MSSLITKDECIEILKKVEPKIDKQLINFEIHRLSDKTVGFLGDHYRLIINYQQSVTNETSKAEFFFKCMPQANANANAYVTEMGVFQKEILLYRDLLPEMQKLVSVKFCPKSYLNNYEKCYLVLEDLSKEGYAASKADTINDAEIEAVLQTLAAFHASSILYEEKHSVNGKIFRLNEEYQEALKEGTFSSIEGHARYKWGKTTTKAVADCAALLPQFANSNELRSKIVQFLERHVNEYIKPSVHYRNVMTHDDLWKNNIMFRKSETGMVECVFVDFQLTRYTPPALDVLIVLYLIVDSYKLQNLMPKYLDTYYRYFAEQLSTNGIDPHTVLSREEFFKSIEVYRLPALLEAVMFGTNVFLGQQLSDLIMSDENVFKEYVFYNRSRYVCQEFKENDAFRRRFCEVLEPFVECLMSQ